tara:strand:+ start:439 stop:1041 length:603 start_codon:yes stop_codon:yes gene_type:complete
MISVVDIGSPKAGKLGWAILPDEVTGNDMDELAARISKALLCGRVALGFESPMWVPKRLDPMKITSQRIGEAGRPWSAGAGSGALATGLVVVQYLLQSIRQSSPGAVASMDYLNPPEGPNNLLLWEAFVSAADKGANHQEDAMIAARSFENSCGNLAAAQRLVPEPCLNLLGAMLLRTGWSTDSHLLASEMLVLKNMPTV